jgi:DNA-binding CsgD family transcriptional regulator/tetratricopeptide (TPR) repeat protein
VLLLGRDGERAEVGGLLDAARASRSGALVVRGEAGVGKTALLEDARERAVDMHVLGARGVESELELPFAALHQLLRPALGHLERLPEPQAAALGAALGLAGGPPPERFLVFAACLSLLSELSERRPVLCLVDDAHWLDAGSADALRFVARRLEAEGIAMLFAAREGDVRAFEAPGVPSLALGALEPDAAAALLARGAGVEMAEAVRERLVERTGGNALALLEVPSALSAAQLAGQAPLPEALPMTREVERVFVERVRRLPAETQRLLLVAAADDSEAAALVVRAGERLGIGPHALDAAEEASLIAIHGGRLTFRHPLVRSALYGAAPSSERWEVHGAIAAALEGDDLQADRRAWHLAASALEPDDRALEALEDAARRAEERGGNMAAARALERAAELSSDGAARARRLVAAAMAASVAGADDHAVALARRALPLVTTPAERAAAAMVLGTAEYQRGRPLDAVPMLIEAADDVAASDPRRALDLLMIASSCGNDTGTLAVQREAARHAEAITPPEGDEGSAFLLDFLRGCGAMVEGDEPLGIQLLERTLDWAAGSDDERLVYVASAGAFWLGGRERGDALAARAASLARSHGALGVLTSALAVQAGLRLMAQRFDAAALAAREALDLSGELGARNLSIFPVSVLATVAAVRGDEETARRCAEEVLEHATARGLALRATSAERALAVLEMGRGRWPEALEHWEAVAAARASAGRTLLAMVTVPDLVEAAVRAGRPDRARAALGDYASWAAHSGTPWTRPRLASCEAMLAEGQAATGRYEAALAQADDALPFDLARIRLLFGEHLRRERRRADAREQLRAAAEAFDRMGAAPWAERARVELRATGERARRRDAGSLATLTPQELQVARLVAEGLANKEVAAQLFLSPRTIDAHLRNVFAKLGITSRGQLARLPLDDEGAAVTA